MDDEYIIKRKLLFDGEGLGDDRRLNLLQKMIAKLLLTQNSKEENQALFNKICFQLSAVEHSRHKSELVKMTYQKEAARYQQCREQFERNIKDIKTSIEASKLLLQEVKNSKHRKLNYDMIAKNILAEPSRAQTSRSVKDLQNNLIKMKDTETKLNEEWSTWRKHFSMIVVTANHLNALMGTVDFSKE